VTDRGVQGDDFQLYGLNLEEDNDAMDKLLTIADAAELLQLAPGTIYHLISRRALPCVRLSKRCVRFRQSELEEWISSHSEHSEESAERETAKKT
jgi:excisionase family DNA binding protein